MRAWIYRLRSHPSTRCKAGGIAGYGLLAAMISVCGVVLWRTTGKAAANPGPEALAAAPGVLPLTEAAYGLTVGRRLKWVLLSFAPSSLLLGVTTYITTDIAAVPLLWVVPLGLYLLTFVLVFARRPPLRQDLMVRLQPFLVLPLAILFLWGYQAEGNLVLPLHLLAFFVCALVCHGELARSRPPATYLTEFYLWLSVGGVLGGLFNALAAPLIFNTVVEYPLALVLACLLRPWPAAVNWRSREFWLDFALPLTFGLILAALVLILQASSEGVAVTGLMLLISSFAAMVGYTFAPRPLRFGLAMGAIMLAGVLYADAQYPVLHQERTFFGVLQVKTDPTRQYHVFYHGTTLHGAQSLDPNRRRDPLTYFHAGGPIGQLFNAFIQKPRHQRVAIIGLGSGSLSCYAWGDQHWTFYEIDPAVERIAREPRYFTYLKDCPAEVEVILGDARLTLAQAPDHSYDLIIFDAFSSDAVPLHLISKEALKLYLDKLADGGLLAYHISNRYLNLQPALGNLARDAGLACIYQDYNVNEAEQYSYYIRSMWVVMARQPGDLGELAADQRWTELSGDLKSGLWTDDFSNILSAFQWPAFKLPFNLTGKKP